jgi:hypothetical protein
MQAMQPFCCDHQPGCSKIFGFPCLCRMTQKPKPFLFVEVCAGLFQKVFASATTRSIHLQLIESAKNRRFPVAKPRTVRIEASTAAVYFPIDVARLPNMAKTLARLVHHFAKQSPMADAVLSPFSANVPKFTYASLSSRASNLAAALHARSYKAGDIIISDLPNTEDNLLLQVSIFGFEEQNRFDVAKAKFAAQLMCF